MTDTVHRLTTTENRQLRAVKQLALTVVFCTAAISPSVVRDCTAEQASHFAWWVGTWDYAIPKYDPAVSTIVASNGGCSLTEDFVDRGGGKMHATITHADSGDTWVRVVTDPSRTYRSVGKFAPDGSIAFYENATDRETYRPVDRDHVHYIGEKSDDAGKTWHAWFDATYTRRR